MECLIPPTNPNRLSHDEICHLKRGLLFMSTLRLPFHRGLVQQSFYRPTLRARGHTAVTSRTPAPGVRPFHATNRTSRALQSRRRASARWAAAQKARR